MTELAVAQNHGGQGEALDLLMPMHLCFDLKGQITHAGPTFKKMSSGQGLIGSSLSDILEIRKPFAPDTAQNLLALAGQNLQLVLRSTPHLLLRGTIATLPEDAGGILNISPGLSFIRVVDEFGLSLNDFSPCDQTVELMYLYEANQVVSAESRKLTARLMQARATAEEQALTDTLTGLSNRRALEAVLTRLLSRPDAHFALMHLDLDYFKQVNDTFGHAAGDHVLHHVAHILRSELRAGDMAARFGGDEFVILLRDCDDVDYVRAIAERLITSMEKPIRFEGNICKISASVGITLTSRYDRPEAAQLLNDADVALYMSKAAGRACASVFQPEQDCFAAMR